MPAVRWQGIGPARSCEGGGASSAACGMVAANATVLLVLVPCGELSLLPIHSARLPDGSWLGQHLVPRYLPSQSFLQGAVPTVRPEGPLVFLDLLAQGAGAEATDLERSLAEDFASTAQIPFEVVTSFDSERIARAGILHVAGHGEAHPAEPGCSALLREVSPRRLVPEVDVAGILGATAGPSLVIGSACQGGRPPEDFPDDQLSLATAFLASGPDGIIATQWNVIDNAAVALIAWIYAEMECADGPAEACNDALLDVLRWGPRQPELAAIIPAGPHPRLGGIPVPASWTEVPFVGIESWAAFAYFGR